LTELVRLNEYFRADLKFSYLVGPDKLV
jgi:hypothetical protein